MIQLEQEIMFDVPMEQMDFIRQACEEIVRRQMQDDMAVVQKPTLKLNWSSFVIVNNLPQITADKEQKLNTVLKSILNKLGLQPHYLDVKINLTGQGLIYCVSEEAALKLSLALQGFQMDQKHVLQAYVTKEFDQIMQTGEEYKPLNLKPKRELQAWLKDSLYRNQIVFEQDKSKITLQWFQPLESSFTPIVKEIALPAHEKLEWSKNGTYLVVYSEEINFTKGFSLYGGHENSFERLHTFAHPKVINLTFSPNEEYALSFNGTAGETSENYILWKVRQELKLRVFKAEQQDILGTYKFSSDSQYLARVESDYISIYKAPKFYLHEEKKHYPNVQNYIWVEKTNTLCIACYGGMLREHDKQFNKTSIVFLDVVTKKEMRWRNIQNESDKCDLYSNMFGRYVCALLKKKIKRKVVATMVQVANLKKKDENLEVVNLEFQEELENVFFEPRNGRIAIQFKDKDKNQRAVSVYNYKLYTVEEGKSIDCKEMGTFMHKETNEVMWSNNGIYFAFVNTVKGSPDQGKIDFAIVLKKQSKDSVEYHVEITKSTNHFYMSDAAWDPSGTLFVTMSEQWSSIIIWTGIGEQLVRDNITKINYINWRLKPTGVQSEEAEQKLQDLLKKKDALKRYEEEDDKIINKAKHDKEDKREQQKNEVQTLINNFIIKFLTLMLKKKQQWKETRKIRAEMLGFDADDKSRLEQIEIIDREEIVEQVNI